MATGTIKNLSSYHNYSAVPTKVLSNPKLSANSKSVLAFLLSLPKNHSISKKDLPNYFKEGYFALNTAFEELVKHRYIHTIALRNKNGHFKGYNYEIYDVPTRRNGGKKVLPGRSQRKTVRSRSVDVLLNKIWNEDCLITMDKMPDQCVDMVLTSPPYNDTRKYQGNAGFEFEKIAIELTRVLKPGGVIVWVVGDETKRGTESGTAFKQALFFKENCGLRLHDTMIFQKNTTTYPAPKNGSRYSQVFEYMFVLSKGKPKTVNLIADKPNKWSGTTNFGQKTDRDKDDNLVPIKKFKPIPEYSPRTNIWRYVTANGYSTPDSIAHRHPAVFPEKLVAEHLTTWSAPNDIIYDPFLGSGTVAKVSQQMNRFWIGSEVVKEYCEIAETRLQHQS